MSALGGRLTALKVKHAQKPGARLAARVFHEPPPPTTAAQVRSAGQAGRRRSDVRQRAADPAPRGKVIYRIPNVRAR